MTCNQDGLIEVRSVIFEDESFQAKEEIETFNVVKPINQMRGHSEDSGKVIFATGGKENDLKLWDLQEKKNIWSAKNVHIFPLFSMLFSENELIALKTIR